MEHDRRKLRDLRQRKGMTQQKLATMSKVSERTVQRAEKGAPMSLEVLNDLAAALEVPVSELIDVPLFAQDTAVALRRVTSPRAFIDDLSKAGVALFDCTVDPMPAELQAVLTIIETIEARLPVPWEFNERPASLSLREKIELSAKLTDLITTIEKLGIGVFSASSWIRARYPYYDMDEGVTCTRNRQPYENVMTMRILVARSENDRAFIGKVTSWGLDEEPPPAPFADDDDVPF